MPAPAATRDDNAAAGSPGGAGSLAAAKGLVHPAFAPFARWWVPGSTALPPDAEQFDGWARAAASSAPGPHPPRFGNARSSPSALDYERAIAATGVVPLRAGSLHDACNALAWLAFPRTKRALNAIHAESGAAATGNARGRSRDAATLVDESGLVVVCAEARMLEDWRARRWRAAFGDRRGSPGRRLHAVVIGHGLLAKLVRPYPGLTAHALPIPVEGDMMAETSRSTAWIDAAAASAIVARGADFAPDDLLPLPVAALPGWDTLGLGDRLFDDATVFRPHRAARAGAR